jgi:hypothetical protein
MPTLPQRPPLPSFCTSNETTLYILGHCTVQNNKVYVGRKFARELEPEEQDRLNEFAARLAENNYTTTVPTTGDNSTVTNDSQPNIVLDFCHEF